MKLSLEKIRAALPCNSYMRLIKKEWPDGIPLTLKSAKRAIELNLDLVWAALHLLPFHIHAKYEKSIRRTHAVRNKALAAAHTKYRKATAATEVAYMRTTAAKDTKYC